MRLKPKNLLFLLLILSSLEAQDLAQLRLTGSPERSESEFVSDSIKDANGRTCTAIKVISDMEGFSYDANNGVVKVDDQPGRDLVYLSPDERVLEIFHIGFAPFKLILSETGIIPAARRIWTIRMAGNNKIAELSIGIITTPPGAQVFIDGENKGTEERHILTTGSHDLRLTRPGFQPVDTTIDVNEKNTLFRFELKKQEDVNIKISSDPAGAMVYLNGVRVEQTPLNSFYPAGQYTLRIEKEWYLPFEEIVDIQPPSFIRQFKLEEDFASLTVQSVPESGLDIWINNVAQNRQTPYTFARLAPGNYIIRARSSLYEAAEQRISLQRGEDKTITLASSANFATLTINTRPGAIIHINGILQESLQNIRLEPQVVTVKAELAKARSAETRLVLQRGENRVLDLYPELLAGAIQVAVVPEDAEIVLRGDAGEYYRGTDAISISEVPIGNYSLTVSRAGYSSHTESFVLHEGEKVNRSVRLEIAKTPSYEPWRPPVTSHETQIKINRVFDYKTSIFVSYLRFPVEIRPNELYAGSFTGSSNREINAGTCLQVGATFREGTDKAGGFDLGWISVNNWGVLHADINYGIIKSAIPGVITLKMLAGGGVGLVVSSNQNWRRPDGDYADAIGRNEGQARATHFLTYRVSAGADFFISRNVSVFARVGYQGFSGAFAGDWLDKDYDTGDDNVDNRFFDVKKEWLEYDVRKIGGLAFEFGLCSWSIR